MTFRSTAPYLRDLGFNVVPCHSPKQKWQPEEKDQVGRRTLVKWTEWQSKFVPEQTFESWCKQYGDANIQIACGPVSKLCVIDIDGPEAHAALDALEQQHGRLPATWRVNSRRGQHIYFRYEGDDLRNTNGVLGPGLETVTTGKLIVAVGSTHRSGHVYEWQDFASPDDCALAPLPEWIAAKVRKQERSTALTVPTARPLSGEEGPREKKYKTKAWDSMIAELATAGEGKRNATLFRVAAQAQRWVNAGEMEKKVVEEALRAHGLGIGLSRIEVEQTLESAFKRVGGERVDLPDWWRKGPRNLTLTRQYPASLHAGYKPLPPIVEPDDDAPDDVFGDGVVMLNGTGHDGESGEVGHTVEYEPEFGPPPEPEKSPTLHMPGDGDPLVFKPVTWENPEADHPICPRALEPSLAYCAAQPLTELGMARRLCQWFGDHLLYSKPTDWMVWDGMRWKPDEVAARRWSVRTVERLKWEIPLVAHDSDAVRAIEKWMVSCQSNGKIKAILECAQYMRQFDPETLDRDPHLLNTASGIVNLVTGDVTPHEPRFLLSRLTPYHIAPKGKRPERFLRFLEAAFLGDAEMIDYVHRACGYMLTGEVGWQCVFFFYGFGANGKSTLMNVINEIAGDYATTDTPEIILGGGNGMSDSSMAFRLVRLKGARVLTTSELENNCTISTAALKRLTGGDRLTGCYKGKDFLQWNPTHKCILLSNTLPNINDQTQGAWRRLRLIEFKHDFRKGGGAVEHYERVMLKAEGPEILRWFVDGAMKQHKSKNNERVPAPIINATAEYKQDEDVLAEFLAENTIEAPEESCPSQELMVAFKAWAKFRGETALLRWTSRQFGKAMVERGARRKRHGSGYAWLDMKLKPSTERPWASPFRNMDDGYQANNYGDAW